ncbi:hypothetical protein DW709_13600 [Coprococcus sp. AM27-12LB]|nr:hypothetical protein DW709_13600 [Coprococcus sp. AM27-12LB]
MTKIANLVKNITMYLFPTLTVILLFLSEQNNDKGDWITISIMPNILLIYAILLFINFIMIYMHRVTIHVKDIIWYSISIGVFLFCCFMNLLFISIIKVL